ncbi:Ig-like domain-containing protein, partial [uncultured Intestinimonas sp.]|uniref:Ig-like domain-containing protein n=1 Tax=uncultured Intestinimonas sp. TaxID=1689265 RepID=UPI0025E6060B
MKKRRALSSLLAVVMCVQLLAAGASAAGQARSTDTQTSSAEETVYVNTYGGSAREVDFNDHWRFNLGSGSAAVDYNDSTWSDVDLPHDYSIEQEYSRNMEAESGYLPGGTGWYRKTFTLSSEWEGKTISIDFGGVYMNATVYLNGTELGFHPYGYTAFSFVLPNELLNFDGENVIAVEVEHEVPSSRWYSGSGIYRSVRLTVTDPVHVARYGTYVTTPDLEASDGADGTAHIETTVQNDTAADVDVSLRQSIYEKGGEEPVATAESQGTTAVTAGGQAEVVMELDVTDPKLWSTDDPNLYTLVTEVLVDGAVTDTYETEFGFRWTTYSQDYGFALNGEPVKLKGVCMHHDQGPLGSEAWYRAIERQVEILKDMGCNAIRVTHNPAAPELIEIANEKGMMLIDEAFDMWVMEKNGNVNDYSTWFEVEIEADNAIVGGEAGMTWAEFDIKTMANVDKNAPAVIMYSLGNEIFEGTANDRAGEYPDIARDLCTWLAEVDDTRPPTFGQNTNNESTAYRVADVLDEFGGISGINYANTSRFDTWVNRGHLVYYSETASAVNSRGVYDRKNSNSDGGKGDYLLTSYDKSAVGWGAVASDAWQRTLDRDNSMGEFVWTGFDYIGEPTPWNGTSSGAQGVWPNSPKSSYFGIIDTNGIPKDTYWFYQSQWNEDVTTLHLLPGSWNEEDLVFGSNDDVEVVVYSDAPVVKLYLNGEEVGTATSTEQVTEGGNYTYRTWTSGTGCYSQASGHKSLYATFWVPYEAGTLEVKAFEADGVTEIAGVNGAGLSDVSQGRTSVTTTGAPSRLEVEADRAAIDADGDDLSYITISVLDAAGEPVNTDDVEISLSIEGDGEIVGVDNGRQPDHTSYQSLQRNTGAGKLVAVVQSTEDAGSFTVTAAADGVTAGSVTVTTQPVESGGTDNSIVSYTISRYHYVQLGNAPELPETVTVTYRDGSTEEKTVLWNAYDESLIDQVGSFTVTGTIEGTNTTVTVNITMLDSVAALLNYSAAVQVGSTVSLPSSRPAVLADGTILNAEFPVTWGSTEGITGEAGTYTVEGVSHVFGVEIPVTATIRVAEGETTITDNVAQSAHLSQDVPEGQQSDSLEAIIDGSTDYAAGPGQDADGNTRPNPNVWTNYDWSQAAEGNDVSTITFTYDTAQNLGRVELYFFTDTWATALPTDVSFQWNMGSDENGWTDLTVTASEPEEVPDSGEAPVYRVTYDFDAVPAVQLRVKLTNQAGGPDGTDRQYCVGLTEAELYVAQTSFPISDSDALSAITVNGVAVDATSLAERSYTTEALYVAELEVESADNAAYTVLPAYEDVVRILTESEDHSTRGEYLINLGGAASAGDPADGSRDYDYTKTTVTVASEQPASGGVEGPKEFAVDGNRNTYWHTEWSAYLENRPELRWIQLELEEPAVLDALRYQPRPTVANGIVTEYRVEVSMTGEEGDWQTVATGTWAHDTEWKIAAFDAPVEAKFVRLYGVHTRGGGGDVADRFMSCAELRVRLAESKPDLSTAEVTLEQESFDYTGSEIRPIPTVTLDGETLRYGVDFLIDYENNIQPGTATLTVRGIVQYEGSVSITFTINEVELIAQSYSPVSVTTHIGDAPALPEEVTAQVNVGPDVQFPVVWDEIDPEQYAQAGPFTVEGTVEGQALKPTATVVVIGPVQAQNVSAATVPGQVPDLPESLAVYFTDGSSDQFPVTWDLEGVSFDTAGETVTVTGALEADGQALTATATVRVLETVSSDENIALGTRDELPFAMASHGPANDAPAHFTDGERTATVDGNKVVWSDWVRDEFHDTEGNYPWVGVILGQGDTVRASMVDRISIGFIEEDSTGASKVRLPVDYTVQYYVGDEALLEERDASAPNSGATWALADEENWADVEILSKDEVPTTDTATIADMCETTFEPVYTAAIRVVIQPQESNWVAVDELEIYGMDFQPASDFTVTAVTLDGEDILDQFDENGEYTVTLTEDQALPVLGAQVDGDNAAVTIVQPALRNSTGYVIVTSEDGSRTETYTVHVQEEIAEPEPEVFTVTFHSEGGSTVEPIQVEEGQLLAPPEPPTRSGYTFDGWYTADGALYTFTEPVTADLDLYARWIDDSEPEEPDEPDEPDVDEDHDAENSSTVVTRPGETGGSGSNVPETPDEPGTDIDEPETPLAPGVFTDVPAGHW